MAPSNNTPRKRNREDKFFNPGVQGRKTGLTIPENARDELGIEAIGGIFSSPRKSSPARQAVSQTRAAVRRPSGRPNGSVEGSPSDGDEMDLGADVGLQPPREDRRVFSSRRGKIALPPPRGKSPMKTNLNSPARRPPSMPALSSPVPPSRRGYSAHISSSPRRDEAEKVELSTKAVNRRLNFAMDKASTPRGLAATGTSTSQTSQRRTQTPRDAFALPTRRLQSSADARVAERSSPRERPSRQTVTERNKKRGLFRQRTVDEPEDENDLSESELDDDAPGSDQEVDANVTSTSRRRSSGRGDESTGRFRYDDDEADEALPSEGDEEIDGGSENVEEEDDSVDEAEPAPGRSPTPMKRGRKASAAAGPAEPKPAPASAQKRGRGRPLKQAVFADNAPSVDASLVLADETAAPGEEEVAQATPLQRGRGRPPKRPLRVQEDLSADGGQAAAEADSEPASRRRRKNPPSKRNPNARIVSAAAKKPHTTAAAAPKRRLSEAEMLQAAAARSNWQAHLLRAPEEDPTAVKTRSGRTAVKPMEFWRNERAIYTDRNSLSAIVRTEEVALRSRRRGGAGSRGAKTSRRRAQPDEDEDEDEMEDWERSPGLILGDVRAWDGSLPPGAEADTTEAELAYAPSAIVTRPVANATFRYLKTLGLDFFGSGIIDIPPRGSKNRKNSRKWQMAFFVFEGRVRVRVGGQMDAATGAWVGGTEFGVGKGGMWQVPRGNLYGIVNEHEGRSSRVFFSQGCVLGAEGEEPQ